MATGSFHVPNTRSNTIVAVDIFNSQIAALQEAGPASEPVTLGAKVLSVATLAVDIAVRRVTAQDRIERSLALATSEAFLEQKRRLTIRNILISIDQSKIKDKIMAI